MVQIGDKFTIREDLKINEHYGKIQVNNTMINMGGQEVTVKTLARTNTFYIEEDNQLWTWTKEMMVKHSRIKIK